MQRKLWRNIIIKLDTVPVGGATTVKQEHEGVEAEAVHRKASSPVSHGALCCCLSTEAQSFSYSAFCSSLDISLHEISTKLQVLFNQSQSLDGIQEPWDKPGVKTKVKNDFTFSDASTKSYPLYRHSSLLFPCGVKGKDIHKPRGINVSSDFVPTSSLCVCVCNWRNMTHRSVSSCEQVFFSFFLLLPPTITTNSETAVHTSHEHTPTFSGSN